MALARSLAILALGTALAGSGADAADFFVKAVTPGPVTGTPLGIVTLQADDDKERPLKLLAVTAESTTETGGAKWVKVRKGKGTSSTSSESSGTSGTSSEGSTTTGTTEGSGTTGSTAGTTEGTGTTTGTTEGSGTTGSTTGTTGTTGSTTGTTTGGTTTVIAPAPTQSPTAPAGAQIWASLDTLLQSGQVTGGDRIFLLDGYHGQITVRDQKFSAPVLIAPAGGAVAHADTILVLNSSNLRFQGLKVWPRQATATNQAVVRSYADTSDLAFTDLDVRATADAGNYAAWTLNDWLNNQRNGIQVDGNRITVARNRITGIYHGVLGLAANTLIEANIVDGFAGDGMRALGDGSTVRRNKVQNCHQINGNHTDGFQSWSRGPNGPGSGTVRDITVEDNKIFEVVGARSPFNCKLQGIVMFDGIYENFLIRNNVISTTAYHGISIYGGLNSRIVNNTVIHAGGVAGRFPWIRINNHKNGTPSRNVTAANNLVTANKVISDPATGIVETNNVVVTNASAEFASVQGHDFTLKPTAKAIDAGAPALAPNDDLTGAARPKGKAPDAGAYENF